MNLRIQDLREGIKRKQAPNLQSLVTLQTHEPRDHFPANASKIIQPGRQGQVTAEEDINPFNGSEQIRSKHGTVPSQVTNGLHFQEHPAS